MKNLLTTLRKGYGKKLVSIHLWNAWLVLILALSGLMLVGGFWRELLGEGRVWLKWGHIVFGLALLIPVVYYLLLAAKHWKRLKGKPAQKANVLFVLTLLIGWLISGVVLWQFRLAGPRAANTALFIHDLLTWVGLPVIIYHSITRVKWLKEPKKRTIVAEAVPVKETFSPAGRARRATPSEAQPMYSRRGFIKVAVGAGLAVTLGPTFVRWIGKSLQFPGTADYVATNANALIPDPVPLAESAPPIGGGAEGSFRVYTVTAIPAFDNSNWSFTIDGLVDKKLSWNWEEFVKLQREVQVSDFHCVTGWSVYKNTWEGLPLSKLLDMAGVQPGAVMVKLYSGDGVYTDSLTLDQARMDDIMVAVMHDGKPIPNQLGGPVRLVTPQMYAYKSVKWLNRIELINEDYVGYWEQRGYDKDAWLPGAKRV
ncbi:oxidoreductase molybdopterin binding protein [Paenibacillus sp. FSL R7-277]|uniref:molybdopterin-dependent oxidoreductase n=1 Tax=Paenibacillus sp. FSL R7-277 TaxID=1227352 RepID=UPI0003E1CFEB|nr:molybdopterin-dependent oxidoreductase [Paenibacillus sp. FSL R7-277]ETT80001.1 oxidoreductase molybdopterin binding protein [Paenibacillus sp. FSL R7-277]